MRDCNGCTLCCLLTDVPAFKKPIGTLCEFCDKDVGCLKYENRDEVCKGFFCVWHTENLPDELRPDRSKVMLERLPGSTTYVALVEPGHDKAWLTPTMQNFLTGLTKQNNSVVVSVNAGAERYIKCPAGGNVKKVMAELKQSFEKYISQGIA